MSKSKSKSKAKKVSKTQVKTPTSKNAQVKKPNCGYCTEKFEMNEAYSNSIAKGQTGFRVRKYPHIPKMCVRLRDHYEKNVDIPV